ncbi:hypothetical protein D8B26_001235 [Coccidioides posadasii str. Silveira]|uniref:RNA binding protein Rnp24 n=1 Tax=Coccidioides posadasii (strain RMSCC 757 / Silveira) TaxID=443226 RepID=E9DA75_COCPS|nr:RNA binding protein Rnp24 [Coccidioides posadasii str. Silveira]QVM06527.1 hypothetical protein D8B26_001235 [Coccidioides posadasii str. Silveira]
MGDRPDSSPNASRKRKLDPDIEIDLGAPEPPSKKALRKAKKKSTAKVDDAQAITSKSETQPPPQQPTNKRSGFGIWIGNLPFSVAQDDLRNFLTTKGPFTPDEITRIHLPQGEKRNGKQLNKGFAYIDFSTSGAVQRAIVLSEQLLAGRAVLIKDANNFAGRPDKPRDDGGTSMGSKTSANPPSKKIFVGNLAFDITKEMLEEHYRPCGGISHVHIATFEDSGKCKGYGWVEFEELESAAAAVRGFVKVPADEEANAMNSSESDENSRYSKDKKKPREKKVWVNRLLGRTLRMEFAEDSTTRYKKRFGKESSGGQGTSAIDGDETQNDGALAPIEEVPFEKPTSSRKKASRDQPKPKARAQAGSDSRYSEETVQRLSGAIVESQGKKTTFD